MITQGTGFQPNYASPPGYLIQEYLEELGISARELARRCGRSPKLISEILLGKAALEPETAMQLERVLNVDASIWLGVEAAYRLHLARVIEEQELSKQESWAKSFPLKELESRGYIKTVNNSPAERVRGLLRFFGAGNVPACHDRFNEMLKVAYRHSPTFESKNEGILAWLRIGEIEAEKIPSQDYDRNKFLDALRNIRLLTRQPIEIFLPEIERLSAEAGVAFIVTPALDKISLSGVSRWLTPRKALIQQTFRHLSNDHFWFTFFHECAHLLLHSRKSIFVEGKGMSTESPEELEANSWAANFLVPEQALTKFIQRFSYAESQILEFAEEQEIAPGIIVGQLQHRKVLRFSQMNGLRERYKWEQPASY